ncbi:MAG: hypothetical protein U5L45_16530 [Saprospiraceae bacterium]|nr:hypothetical protein [Saprospiraceae bacterium]
MKPYIKSKHCFSRSPEGIGESAKVRFNAYFEFMYGFKFKFRN